MRARESRGKRGRKILYYAILKCEIRAGRGLFITAERRVGGGGGRRTSAAVAAGATAYNTV